MGESVREHLSVVVLVLSLLLAGVSPVAGATSADGESLAAGGSELDAHSQSATDPGEIKTLEITNTTDSNDNGEYANFDLYIQADTRLPADNDDSDGEAEPRLKVVVDGVEVYDNIEVAPQENLEGTIPIPKSVLPSQRTSSVDVTVILWEDDPAGDDTLDQYTISVPYEADESSLEIIPSRTSTVVGSPIYIGASGGQPGYQIQVVDAPSGSQAVVQSHTSSAVQFRPDVAGTYVIEVEDSVGATVRTELTVRDRSELIDQYAPILNFDNEEDYRPTRYEAMVENANLYEDDVVYSDLISDAPSMFTLGDYGSSLEPVLDLDGDEADYTRYDDQYSPTVYASVHQNVELRGEVYTAVTYWMFYVYDPKTDGIPSLAAHQSDLETVTVFINDSGPQWVAASQHKGGELREWEKVPRDGTHLQLYPAVGAHSSYLTNTENYNGDGLIGQEQFAQSSSQATTTFSGTFYQDTTGSDRQFTPTGDGGTAYDIVPLTGNEIWADFSGGFASDYDDGQVPMQRDRWRDVGEWAEGIPSDEDQRDAEIEALSTDVTGNSLDVTAEVENTGPKPDTFHLLIYAKPSESTWDSQDVTYLGSESVALGTGRSKSITATVEPDTSVSGSWDILVLTSIYSRERAEQEDIVAEASRPQVYTVEAQTTTRRTTATQTPTTQTTAVPTPTETARPTTAEPTSSATVATTSAPDTTSEPATETGSSQQSSESTDQPPTTGSSVTEGSPGFTGVLGIIAVIIFAVKFRRR